MPRFVTHALNDWSLFNGARLLYIDPSSPWQNGLIQSFNDRLRDAYLNDHQFDSLFEVKTPLGD